MGKKKKGKNKKVEGALYFLLITWSILLLLLIFIFILRLKGYDSFQDWKNSMQEEAEPSLTPPPDGHPLPTLSPALELSGAPAATPPPDEAGPEITQGITPQPTAAGQKEELGKEAVMRKLEEQYGATTKEYGQTDVEYDIEGNPTMLLAFPVTGDMRLDAAIREDIAGPLKEAAERLASMESGLPEGVAALALNYDCYHNDNWLSIVFRLTEEVGGEAAEIRTTLLPLVYRMDTGERVKGQEMFHETYFAILKERLMEEIVNYIDAEDEVEEPFLSYAIPYRAEDYSLYYLMGDNVVFYFPEGTLTEQVAHGPFTYEANLSEALAFMKYNLSGKSTAREIRELDPDGKMIALTFDDGVHSPVEEQLLNMLAKYDARATFFSLGERTFGSRGDTLRDLYDAGHEIASHTYSHKYLTREDEETFWREINDANLQIAKVVGHAPDYLRMPGGDYPEYSDTAPMPLIHWSLDSRDWKSRNADAVYSKVLSEVRDGDIILLHSLYQSTADAVERLLPKLAAKGYQFVTVSELFYYKGITPECGKKYKNGD